MDRTRPLDRLFFIYDHSVIQREEDDPKDAISYFYPPNFSVDTQCLLCGQLMGMVNFLKILSSSEPRIYKLRKMKITTKSEGNFTVALAHDPKVSDVVAIEMVNNLYGVFCMYHGSLTRLLKHCHGNRETFSSQMSSIWNCYLPYIRHYGNTMKTIFNAVPTIELPKKCGWIFLKCSHLLQWLKRKPWLLAGCLLYKNKVLCTQLTSDLMARLLLIKSSQNAFPGEKLTTDYDLPFGVRILSIYLREEEYKLFAKPESATGATSEKAEATHQTSQKIEETLSTEEHQTLSQQSQGDKTNQCNRDSCESDVSRRTSSSPESSDVGQSAEAVDAGADSERYRNCHIIKDDKTDEAEGSCRRDGSRSKRHLPASGNSIECDNERGEHSCRNAKVNGAGYLEQERQLSADTHYKSNHEHSTQGDVNVAFDTNKDNVNMIIDHPKDTLVTSKNLSSCKSDLSSSEIMGSGSSDGTAIKTFANCENDDIHLKNAEEVHSSAPGTFGNPVISTAVSELSSGGIDSVLLPKVQVDYDGGNLEDEPFEIHINPLDSESSPEHSDSSSNAVASVMPRQRLEPLADDNGNILLQDDTRRLQEMHIGPSASSHTAGHTNDAEGVMLRSVQDPETLSKNNSHSRDSLSQDERQQTSTGTTFSHSYKDQNIPQTTQMNGTNSIQAKPERNMDSSSSYSTQKASKNLNSSSASGTPAVSTGQDGTHHGTNSELTNNSAEVKQWNSSTNGAEGPRNLTSSVQHGESQDSPRDPAASVDPEGSPLSPTGGLVRADGTRRRGWTRSRSSNSVTSPRVAEEETTKVEGMVNVSLYVQAHSDTMLIFLGEKNWIKDKSRLLSMWQSFVIKLADLELELQQVLNDKVSNQDQDLLYNFLQFSPFEKSMKSNTKGVATTENRDFVSLVETMHETFVSNEKVNHIVMRGQHSTVIGSQNDAYQTYFQPLRVPSSTSTSASSSSPSTSSSSPGMYATSAIATRQGKMEAQAEKLLSRDHGIRFL